MKTPTPAQLEGTTAEGTEPSTLCLNWQDGCNAVTDGENAGELTLCDYCKEDANAE
jgi:hypothetical protein